MPEAPRALDPGATTVTREDSRPRRPAAHRALRSRAARFAQYALPLLAAASALAQAGSQTAPARIEDADDLRQIVAAAKKEGALTLYTSIAEKDLPVLIEPFEKKYGVKVRVWRASTVKVLQRTLSEAAARRYEVDAIHISSPEMEALHRERLLRPVVSGEFRRLVAGAVPAHHEWTATVLSAWVQAYNTTLVKKQDLPRTYADLLDPRWKGKLGIEAEDQEWFGAVVRDMGEEQGLKFFRELVRRNGVSVREGHTLLTNMVVSGEVPLALTVYNYMPETAKRRGAPIDWTAIAPAFARTNAVGVARNAPHPNAALLFFEYMISDAQKLMPSIDYIPTNTSVPSPLKGLNVKLVDPARSLDEREKWTRAFEDIFVRHSGS